MSLPVNPPNSAEDHPTHVSAYGPLADYAQNEYSQFGEDGILKEILRRLGRDGPDDAHWCVEFGAWDGVYLSNTYRLISQSGWRAVLIEADPARHRELCRNIPSEDVIKLCRFVGFGADDSLDAILGDTPIPEDFDLLSIDIDGCDYHVWQSMMRYRPKIVCIEHNPTIPVDVPYVQPRDFAVKHGNGAKAIDMLAHEKGYRTVALTTTNVIAVREDLVSTVLDGPPPTIEDLLPDHTRQFIFFGYDGTLLSNREALPANWHSLKFSMDNIQPLPRYLQRFPDDYSPLQALVFRLFRTRMKLRRMLRGTR